MIQVEKEEDHGITLNAIQVDGGTQSRATLNQHVVDDYAAAIKDGATFPPIVVFYDGKKHWLADGFHRFHAFQKLGREAVVADVRQGTRRDAILHSVGANETHGLRRTNDDKRRAVLTLLNDSVWSKWTDREIGRACQVDHKTVGKIRTELPGEILTERVYTTKHGTTATMKTAGINASRKTGDGDKTGSYPQNHVLQGVEVATTAEKAETGSYPNLTDDRTDVEREADAIVLAWDKASPDAREKFIAYLRLIGFTITECNQATGMGGEDVDRSALRASSAVEVGATKSPERAQRFMSMTPIEPREANGLKGFGFTVTFDDPNSVPSSSQAAEQTGAVPVIPAAPVAPPKALSKADQMRQLRPHCQHPGTDLCGGSGRTHCHACKKLMAEGEAA